MDARVFLQSTDAQYDMIFLDVFQSGHFIPPHLSTQEFFTEVAKHIRPGGIFVTNVIGQIDENSRTVTGSLIKTIGDVLSSVQVFQASNSFKPISNFIVIAHLDTEPIIVPDDFVIDLKNGTSTPANQRELSLERFHLDQQKIFTDDLAPVELLVAKQILDY
jgi:hypothetical protein